MHKLIPCTFLLSATFLSFSSGVWAEGSEHDAIPHLGELAPGIYRGGQPTEAGYQQLKAMGIKTIVNFRHEEKYIQLDRELAGRNGMDYVSIPWTIYGNLDRSFREKFFSIVEDKSKYPIFIHCKRGVERTGVFSAAYYMAYENMSPDQAYQKAFEGYPVRLIWKPFVAKQFNFLKEDLKRS